MIGRMWHGWTEADKADAYQVLLEQEILPEIQRTPGCRGAYVLRRGREKDVEFVTLLLFESLDAIHAFAGEQDEAAVVQPEAQALLHDFDSTVLHYDVVVTPDPPAS